MSLLKFDPATGHEKPYPSHPDQYRKHHGQVAWIFNPFTGAQRDARDIGADVLGLALLEEEQDSHSDISQAPALEWSQTLLDGKSVSYANAEKAIAALGEGWRLPTRAELESLLDLSRHDPAIDADKYPDTKSTWYWSNTPCAWNDSAVWVVHFRNGYVGADSRNDNGCVRAVRSSQ